MPSPPATVAVAVAAFTLVGCAPRIPPTQPQVRRITFEGNGPPLSDRSDGALRTAIAHPKPERLGLLGGTVSLSEGLLEEDQRRVAIHYAHAGYFAGRLVRWEVRELKPATGSTPPVVELVGIVEEGAPSKVTSVTVEGIDGLPRALQRRLRRQPDLRRKTYDQGVFDNVLEELQEALGDAGYAHATVDAEVLVDTASDEVALTYTVTPGVPADFGAVELEGSLFEHEALIERHVGVAPGEPFSLSTIDDIQSRLYNLGVFSIVDIEPQLDGPDPSVVPLRVALQRKPPRTVGGGAGLDLGSGRQEAFGAARFEADNIAQRLISVDADLEGGYATLAASLDDLRSPGDVRGAAIFDTRLRGDVPGFIRPRWTASGEVGLQRYLTEAFVALSPTAMVGTTAVLSDRWELSAAYRLRGAIYTEQTVDLSQLATASVSQDLSDGRYLVSLVEESLRWDTRDDELAPKRGHRYGVTLIQASSALGGEYDFLGAETDLRQYWQVADGFVLAARLGGGVKRAVGESAERGVPVGERYFLGGSGKVRGWTYQRLGPLTCASGGQELPCSEVPIGGNVLAHSSLELRYQWSDFGAVGFVDTGMVWQQLETFWEVPVVPTVGTGLRYYGPTGPVRLDVAFRTDRLERFENEPRVWVHLGVGQAF